MAVVESSRWEVQTCLCPVAELVADSVAVAGLAAAYCSVGLLYFWLARSGTVPAFVWPNRTLPMIFLLLLSIAAADFLLCLSKLSGYC